MNGFATSSHLLASESIAPGKFHAVLTSCKQVGAIFFCPAHVRFLWIMCIQNNEKIFQCNSPLNKNKSGADTYIEELCSAVAAKPWKIDLADKPVKKIGIKN